MSNIDELFKKLEELKAQEAFETALKLLEDAFENQPNSEDIKKLYIDFLFYYGDYLNDEYVLGFDKAIIMFKKIIEIDPDNYRAHYNLGIAHFYSENHEEALIACKKALEIKPDYKFCIYNIGLIHESQNEPLIALEYYKKALEIDPRFQYASQAKKAIEDQLERRSPDQDIKVENVKKFISLLKMSKRLEIEMIQQVLEISKGRLLDMIIKWGNEFDFKLDGQCLILNQKTLPLFIEKLEKTINS